jgi:hypothetical protein
VQLETKIRSAFCLLLACSAGCAPTIYQFDATPARVCKGQSSTLHWKSTHRGSITASPPNDSPGVVFSEGSSVVTPQASGTYHLEATRLLFFSSSKDVQVEVAEPCEGATAAK